MCVFLLARDGLYIVVYGVAGRTSAVPPRWKWLLPTLSSFISAVDQGHSRLISKHVACMISGW